jgi:GT2 family glycosyltransferase
VTTPENSTASPSVAIILVNWNGYEYSRQCLESLRLCTYRHFKIILIDNASHDNSGKKLAEEFPEVIFHQNNSNLGFTGGNNVGLKLALASDFEYSLLLNNDTIVEPNFLEQLINYMEDNDTCAAVQPKIFYLHNKALLWNAGGKFHSWIGISRTIGLGKSDSAKYANIQSTDWISGCCMLIKNSVVEQVGLLDENFFAYYEDVDWSLRIRKAGYHLTYIPQSTIYHAAGASVKRDIRINEGNLNPVIHFYDTRNHLYLLRKHHKGFKLFINLIFQLFKICGYSMYFILRGRFTKLSYALRGFCEGFKLRTDVSSK